MGHVINPISLRLGLNLFWVSNWVSYYSRLNYSYLFGIDYQIFLIFEWFLYFALKRNVDPVFFNIGSLREMVSHYKIYKDSQQMHIVIYVYFEGCFKRRLNKRLGNSLSERKLLESESSKVITDSDNITRSTEKSFSGFSLVSGNRIIKRRLESKISNKRWFWRLKKKLAVINSNRVSEFYKYKPLLISHQNSLKVLKRINDNFIKSNKDLYLDASDSLKSRVNLLLIRRLSFHRFHYLYKVLNFQFKRYNSMKDFFLVLKFYLFIELFHRLNNNFINLSAALSQEFITFRHLRKLTFVPISKEWISANLIFRYIATQLRYHRNLNFIVKLLINKFQRSFIVRGLKIFCTGRFTRKERAMYSWVRHGKVPLNTYSIPLEYFSGHYKSRYGVGGMKIWLYRV